jgi:hypothetical protein
VLSISLHLKKYSKRVIWDLSPGYSTKKTSYNCGHKKFTTLSCMLDEEECSSVCKVPTCVKTTNLWQVHQIHS